MEKKVGFIEPIVEHTSDCKVAYIYSEHLLKLCDKLPKIKGRASRVHHLIHSYGLHTHMVCVSSREAYESEIALFHSEDYIKMLKNISEADDREKYSDEAELFGLTYDCPVDTDIYKLAAAVCGASIQAAQCLMTNVSDVSINWFGGWHHAKKDQASGFSYFNDAVISIMTLYKQYQRILYIDLDLHHGDGVEEAFNATSKVMTVSFHKFAPGFFPGTGDCTEMGVGKGKGYSLNIPLQDGIGDEKYVRIFKHVMKKVKSKYDPQVIVCQCGADGLSSDPMSSFNLSSVAYGNCIKYLMSWKIPLLLLGGGGYDIHGTARCWTHITGVVLGLDLENDIPDHSYFIEYGPTYELRTMSGNRKDENRNFEIKEIIEEVDHNLEYVHSEL